MVIARDDVRDSAIVGILPNSLIGLLTESRNPRTRGTIIVPFPSGVAVFQDPSEGLAKAATIAVLVRIPSDKQYYLPAEESLGQYQIMSYWQAMQSSYSEELVVAGACRCLPEMMKIQFGETTHVSALTLEGKSMPRQTCPTSPLDSCCPCHMDRLEVQVLKSNGEVTSLCLADGEGVKEVLQSLGEGGYVVLKEATDLRVSPGSTEIRSNRVRPSLGDSELLTDETVSLSTPYLQLKTVTLLSLATGLTLLVRNKENLDAIKNGRSSPKTLNRSDSAACILVEIRI